MEETEEVREETYSGAGILCSRELKGLLIGERKG